MEESRRLVQPRPRHPPLIEPDVRFSLIRLACASATSCLAVGNLAGNFWFPLPNDGISSSLIERETGNAWLGMPRLRFSTSDGYGGLGLSAVACAGADHCVIVGSQATGKESRTMTLVLEDAGNGWTMVSSLNVTSW